MTEEQLNKLSIYEIRSLARMIGVASPTSKLKSVLIREIMEINQGIREKHIPKTRQGRPPKNFMGVGLVNSFMPAQTSCYPDRLKPRSFTLAQQVEAIAVGEMRSFTGYIEILKNNTVVAHNLGFNSPEIVIVPLDRAEELDLRAGDMIEGEVEPTTINTSAVLIDIFTINGCPIKRYSADRVDYFDIAHTDATKRVEYKDEQYGKLDIRMGENVFVSGDNSIINSTALAKLITSVQNMHRIYINPAITDKSKSILNHLTRVERFTASIVGDTEFAKRVISLGVNRARRILERGDNVVVVVDDIKSVAGIDDENLSLVKNLLSLSKAGANKGSITVISLISDAKYGDIFDKLCDRHIMLKSGEFVL